MISGLFRFIGRLLCYVWRWLDAVRRTIVNLALLLLIAIVIAMIWAPEPKLPEGAALVLRPAGEIVERTQLEEPLELLQSGGSRAAQTSLRDLLEVVHAARDDKRIAALVLETDHLEQAQLSKLAELHAAITEFKASGKPVLARGEGFTQGQYYLASAASEIHIAPDGFLLMPGLARYVTYFKNALDNLGVKVHVFRVGEYKAFSEPFTRTSMSDEDRASTGDLLDGLWGAYRADIVASRGMDAAVLNRYIDSYSTVLAANGGDAARAARESGLVDRFSTRDEWEATLKALVGAGTGERRYNSVSTARYLDMIRSERESAADHVAVIVAQGAILDGAGSLGSIGGDSLSRLIRDAREDDSVKALVLRIDSPGGSAWASEVIRRELELVREAGKPVVASMSSTAASGGYWIASGADEIWAHPLTLTGSIGIFALFPELAEPVKRLGLSIDGVATGPYAGAFDPRRPLDPRVGKAIQLGIDHGYQRFLDIVAKARDMSAEEVNLVARGRVWTGEAAHKLGLVDQLGGLDDAIAAAAARAGLERYEVEWPEDRLTPVQMLMQHLSDLGVVAAPEHAVSARPSPLGSLVARLQADAAQLLQWNDPRHIYVHCLCEAP